MMAIIALMMPSTVAMTTTIVWKIVMQFVDCFHGNDAEPDAKVRCDNVHQTETGSNTICMYTQLQHNIVNDMDAFIDR